MRSGGRGLAKVVAGNAEAGGATAEATTKGSGHGNLIFDGGDTELGPKMIGLVRTPDLGIARSGPDVERAGHRTCSGRGIEAEACPPLANLLGLDELLLALSLRQHLGLKLLSLLNLKRL